MAGPSSVLFRCLTCIALVTVSACAGMTTYNRERRLNPLIPTSTYVDAKQRVVLASPVTVTNGTTSSVVMRYCAEPSPDALSAIATSGGGGLSAAQKVDLQTAFSLAESASNIGLRTQSIQLMRDAMFRLCEGVVSNNLTSTQFETLYRHFQNSMVAILAIEQLTGTVRPLVVALEGSASAGAAKEIAALTQKLVDARTASAAATQDAADKKAAADKAQAAAKAYLDGKGGKAEALTAEQQKEYAALADEAAKTAAASASAEQKAKAAASDLDTYQKGMNAIAAGNLSASTTATIQPASSGAPLSGDSAKAVADAVQAIVEQQGAAGFLREACATLFVQQIGSAGGAQAAPKNSLEANCAAYAAATVNSLNSATLNAKAMNDALVRQIEANKLTPATVASLTKAAQTAPLPSWMSVRSDAISFRLDDAAERQAGETAKRTRRQRGR